MLAKNLDVSQGLVNGARGVVVGFESEQKGKKAFWSFVEGRGKNQNNLSLMADDLLILFTAW